MDSLLRAPIRELHDLYRRKEISPVEVLDHTLARLERLEPRLNAFVTVLEDSARRQAQEAEEEFLRGGETSPLTGIPISVKDLIAVRGAPMTAGSRILRDHRPDHDAVVHTRLRRTGAVVFAKTNMLEFAYGFVHPDYGQANNPWDVGRTAGGSSSGSAASVGAGIGYASVVTDTGGSARLPAAFCGLVGLRPTVGTIDQGGVLPLAPTLDTVGVLARTVGDNRLLWEALTTARHDTDTPSLRGVRVGVVTDLLGDPLTPQARAVFQAAQEALRQAGAMLRDVRLPGVLAFAEHASVIMLAEAAHVHRRWYPARAKDYAAGTRANLAAGTRLTAPDYLRALDERARFTELVDALLDDVDVLACPTIGFTAPEREPDFDGGGLDYIQRTLPFAATGHPALTVPAGLTATDTMPVGLQLVTKRHREAALYRAAAAYEAQLGGFPQAPLP